MKVYDKTELGQYNGKAGKSAFVSVNGKIYDVTESKRWPQGSHMKRHQAGEDLSEDIKSAPHGADVLDRFQMVGMLQEFRKEPQPGLRGQVETLLERFPFFRRHPHPAVVHFPLGLLMVAPVFQVAAFVFGSAATEWAAFLSLCVGAITIPAAILTGYLTWWVNYDAFDNPTIRAKRRFAWMSLLLGFASVGLRFFVITSPLNISDPLVILYTIMLVVLAVIVSRIGFLGGKLTFPYE